MNQKLQQDLNAFIKNESNYDVYAVSATKKAVFPYVVIDEPVSTYLPRFSYSSGRNLQRIRLYGKDLISLRNTADKLLNLLSKKRLGEYVIRINAYGQLTDTSTYEHGISEGVNGLFIEILWITNL